MVCCSIGISACDSCSCSSLKIHLSQGVSIMKTPFHIVTVYALYFLFVAWRKFCAQRCHLLSFNEQRWTKMDKDIQLCIIEMSSSVGRAMPGCQSETLPAPPTQHSFLPSCALVAPFLWNKCQRQLSNRASDSHGAYV